MNEIHNYPEDKDFGLGFSYEEWTAGTVATLCQVPWNSDYRDVVHFENDAALNTYLENRPKRVFRNLAYSGFGVPIKLDVPFNVAQKYNYLRAFNPAQPVDGDFDKSFYYFITNVVRASPNTTIIYVQLDAWQTFIRSTVLGTAYIESGHAGIANQNAFQNYGRNFLTHSEGLDVGGEYVISAVHRESMADTIVQDDGETYGYDVLVVSTVKLEGTDHGTVDAPKQRSATGSNMQNLPNGAEIYVFRSPFDFRAFMTEFSDKPYITQGIISITAIPPIERFNAYGTPVKIGTVNAVKMQGGRLRKKEVELAPAWRDKALARLPFQYRKLLKLLTYPYTVLELTTYTGQPIIIKPELWPDNNAGVVEVAHLAPPAQRIAIYPRRYNAAEGTIPIRDMEGIDNDLGEFLDMATWISNFPTFSLVNNGYMSYLASNSNSIAFQHSSADWSNTKALAGADNTANNASMGIAASTDLSNIGVNASIAQNNLTNDYATQRAVVGAAQGIAGGAAMGPGGLASGLAGAAMTGLGTSMDIAQRNLSTGISASASRAGNARSGQLNGDLRDSNLGYARMAANGDYQQAIAGINAKTNDAKLIQNTTSGQMGGDAFLLANYRMGYDLKIKTITGAALQAVGDYMLRYGYKVNRFGRIPLNFQVMTNFTYWKLKEVYILSAECPENIKQALRGILEKGVTVWNNPDKIGNTNIMDNEVVGGYIL